LRQVLQKSGSTAQVVAKIESQSAVREIDDMIAAADIILIARGDLGIECPMEELPIIQRRIVKRCLRLGKPVVVGRSDDRAPRRMTATKANQINDPSTRCIEFIIVVILCEGSLKEKAADNNIIIRRKEGKGITIAINLNKREMLMANFTTEKVPQSLDALRQGVAQYREVGDRFAK